MPILISIFYIIQTNEFQKFAISSIFEHFQVKVIYFVHFKTSDEAYLHAKTSMLPSAINANKYAIINRNPLRIDSLTLDTEIIHICLHFLWILEISFLIFQPCLSFGGWTKSLFFTRSILQNKIRCFIRCWLIYLTERGFHLPKWRSTFIVSFLRNSILWAQHIILIGIFFTFYQWIVRVKCFVLFRIIH